MSRYVLLADAKDDVRQIRQYYLDQDSPDAARTVLHELTRAFRFLAQGPGRGHKREDLTDKRFLFWPVRFYLIVYRPETDPLQIVAVLHGARDVALLLSKRG